MKIKKYKKSGRIITLEPQEYEDLRSAMDLAVELAKKKHKDSPSFVRALKRINLGLEIKL